MRLRRLSEHFVSFWRGLRDPGPRAMLLWIAADLVRFITGAPMRRVSQLTPQLHLGDQYARRDWPILAARGVTAVVNMRAEFDGGDSVIEPARYLYLPTPNDQPPTLAHLRQGVAFITAEIAQGGRVYVHCRSGVGRGATMVAAYLVSTGLPPEQAWANIRVVRPYICPNPAQIAQIECFAQLSEKVDDGIGDVPEFACG